METKRIKYFWLFGSPMNRSYTKQIRNKKICARNLSNCVKSIHESNKRNETVNFQRNKKSSFVVLCKIYLLVNQTVKKIFYPFCFHLNELSEIRHAILIRECMKYIESHYLLHNAGRCDVFGEIAGAYRENLERDKFARSCSRLDVLIEIWRH